MNQRPQDKTRTLASVRSWLKLGYLRSEKCELAEAAEAFQTALKLAKKIKDVGATVEALSRLLRLASEALDDAQTRKLEKELDGLIRAYPKKVPPMAWYCKGVIAVQREQWMTAQRHFHRYLRELRETRFATSAQLISKDESIARAWAMLANTSFQRGNVKRAQWIIEQALKTYESQNLRGMNGLLYLQMGWLSIRQKNTKKGLHWFQRAHESFLAEHNWFYHLYVLYGYACIARIEQNYSQANWYLNLMEKAASGPEFGVLRRQILRERSRLEQDAVDLLIDGRKCVIKTRDGGQISLRKQYVLLHILQELSAAHKRSGSDLERGLSKAEIIERVWKENYRPEAHDNKLYYNINRLRKLIEPNVRQPQYLQNWKEGYRLAPGLRIQVIGGGDGTAVDGVNRS